MPELPEVETVCRTLAPYLEQAIIRQVHVHLPQGAQLRSPVSQRQLRGRLCGGRVMSVRRRAKYLLIDIDSAERVAGPAFEPPAGDAWILLVHLGMSGTLAMVDSSLARKKHDHITIDLLSETAAAARFAAPQLRFNDPRRFGRLEVFSAAAEASHPLLTHLGPEPLDTAACGAADFYAQSRGSAQAIKTFIMDARRIVGVGNIYASEVLFRAGIHPLLKAGAVSRPRWQRLLLAIRETLAEAIDQGGTTLRDFRNVAGEAGYFAVALKVYGRAGQPCTRCGKNILSSTLGGRTTFYCTSCQRR